MTILTIDQIESLYTPEEGPDLPRLYPAFQHKRIAHYQIPDDSGEPAQEEQFENSDETFVLVWDRNYSLHYAALPNDPITVVYGSPKFLCLKYGDEDTSPADFVVFEWTATLVTHEDIRRRQAGRTTNLILQLHVPSQVSEPAANELPPIGSHQPATTVGAGGPPATGAPTMQPMSTSGGGSTPSTPASFITARDVSCPRYCANCGHLKPSLRMFCRSKGCC